MYIYATPLGEANVINKKAAERAWNILCLTRGVVLHQFLANPSTATDHSISNTPRPLSLRRAKSPQEALYTCVVLHWQMGAGQ